MTTVLKNYINGEWVNSKGKEVIDVINPAFVGTNFSDLIRILFKNLFHAE